MADSGTQYIRGPLWDQLVQASGYHTEKINPAIDMFRQTYKSLTGQDPDLNQINDFAQNGLMSAVSNPGQFGYSDMSNLVNNYVQNSAGDQVAANQQQKQETQLGKTQQTIQDLIGKQTAATTAQLTDPNSPTYQQFSGMMNNLGITPSSGAFQAGLGGQIGQSAANATNAALGSVSLPAISGIQGMNQNPYGFAQQNSNLSHINSLGDFGLKAGYDQLAARDAAPSGLDKGLGYGASYLSGAGNAAVGSAALMQATSYVCWELIRRGLLCESDMEDFHIHIMPAMFKKGRAFWKYAMDGLNLVNEVNRKGLDWKVFKPLLFDRVMAEPDPCKAVDLYADACHQLCISSDRSLWDERVMRTSIWDSLRFLPLLFSYKPFREALGKCLIIKMMIIYDKPRCEVHHGS